MGTDDTTRLKDEETKLMELLFRVALENLDLIGYLDPPPSLLSLVTPDGRPKGWLGFFKSAAQASFARAEDLHRALGRPSVPLREQCLQRFDELGIDPQPQGSARLSRPH